jgi:HEAT repeat protein
VEENGESEVVRRTALAYLNRFEDREMDTLLERLLADEDPLFRRRVVAVWEQREPRRAVPLLERVALNDEEERVRQAAVSSLGDISDPLAVEALATVFRRSEDERIRLVALRQRVSLMESDREKITWLDGLARGDESFEVRKEAVRQLGRIEDPAALEALRRLLDNGRHDLPLP